MQIALGSLLRHVSICHLVLLSAEELLMCGKVLRCLIGAAADLNTRGHASLASRLASYQHQ